MTEVTIEEVLAALSERGRLEWEAATQRAIIEAQRREIEALSNGHQPEVAEAVLGGAEN
ncbi:MAG: hypothetical protein QF638_03650 [Acidimicrobiales bacterium]|jgi:hypothetical protein|nr:hypothetical protein [Acidimicrobiales bacterium]|tara:strand:- start:131 stop:307 length:177 start_codon:yes stop_codon:yes gene_type:complete